MTGLRKLSKDLISVSTLFLFIYSIVWVLALAMDGYGRHDFLVLAVPFVVLYVIRSRSLRGYVFFPVSVAACVIAWFFLRYLEADAAVSTFLFLSLVYSVYAWFNDEFAPSITSSGIFFIITFFLFIGVGAMENASEFQSTIALIFLMTVGLTIIYVQMDGFDYKLYLKKSSDGHNLSTKRLVRTNNTMGFAFAGLVLFAGVLSAFFPVHLISRFFSWLGALLAGFGSAIPLDDPFGHFLPPLDIDGQADVYMDIPEERAGTDFSIFAAIITILQLLGLVAVVIMIIYLIIRHVKRKAKPEQLIDSQEEVKLAGSLLDDLFDLLPRFKKARHPLRRAYEKKVNSHIKQGILIENYDTTDIIADKIRDAEDIDELTVKYEVVRYGREI